MTKVLSTRLTETEHQKFLNRCNEKGCNSADLLRDIALEFLNGNQLKGNIIGVLTEDKDFQGSIKIKSSRFLELNDADLVGLVASKEEPGNAQIVFIPFMDDDHEDGIFVKQWPQSETNATISITNTNTKEELHGAGI